MAEKDGGPAFPFESEDYPGMSLRDYFAAKAMPAVPTFPNSLWQAIRWALGLTYIASNYNSENFAKSAYRIADAMLKAREADHG